MLQITVESTLSRVAAMLRKLTRLEVHAVSLNEASFILSFSDEFPLLLTTGDHGDGLYLVSCPPEVAIHQISVDPFSWNTHGLRLLDTRDFSLHPYDLRSDAGLRAAREYVRRKLTALAASEASSATFPIKAELVLRPSIAHGNHISAAFSTTPSCEVPHQFFNFSHMSDCSSELHDSTLTSESSGTLRNFHSKNSVSRTAPNE